MDGPIEFHESKARRVDNVTYINESVGIQMVPEGFEFRFMYEGVLLTCVTMFGLVSNVIAVIVLLRSVNFWLGS